MTKKVRAKKSFGQHFLKDETVCEDLVAKLSGKGYESIIEIGPGMGVLTKYLIQKPEPTYVIEVDNESVDYLLLHYPQLAQRVIHADFLRIPFTEMFQGQVAVVGNFPYNISSQILFKILDHKDQIPEAGGMFQKELAQRVASQPGSKAYGVISVLMQAYYDIEYCFTVLPHVFDPPPKVDSGVIWLKRKENQDLGCDPKQFKTVVKQAFSQRRKTLSNALKPLLKDKTDWKEMEIFRLRAERLSVADFVGLTKYIYEQN
ncbi:MAG: 16S rRNA (adenine(1518)-N(6)/adenine(1519)-N(6))-dimethyltransferase RsmA [Flavobacteriales bacterium]|jgi:16S rRNA (adenine1518-N6/adenine1519-N6)-dimethyltransferase|nr:16S rRNA (adenine(1518)-N(6)/adenine(1519)-N(6))-dimethyltransferase RsmA [Flavobacteriales bacterium]